VHSLLLNRLFVWPVMIEVHRKKVVSSVEARPLRRNVTTEFEWEVRSLKEHGRKLSSPSFKVYGTEGGVTTFFSRFEGYAADGSKL